MYTIPQMIVLKSLLFIIYINILLNLNIKDKIICSTDDILILLLDKSNKLLFKLTNKVMI
jgi:hypothetical protein